MWDEHAKPPTTDPPAAPDGADPTGGEAAPEPADGASVAVVKAQVIEAISTVYDPEIPVNIYELGLVYNVDLAEDGLVNVRMTLTSPMCPAAQQIPAEVQQKVEAVDGVAKANVEIVWDPPWSMDKMSDTARFALGL